MYSKLTFSILSLALIFLCSYNLNAQVTYVDASATGLNNGSDWANAYTSLNDALNELNASEVSNSEEIWVAAGEYRPSLNVQNNLTTFYINVPVDLYGGFDGTETEKSQRNLSANQVILSGDIANNDNNGMDSLARLDNVLHVMFIDSFLSRRIIIDGITISGGQTIDDINVPFDQRAGGGIYSLSSLDIRDCTFFNNFGRLGGSIAFNNRLETITESVLLTNCSFDRNMGTAQSSGPAFYGVNDVQVRNCSFTNNINNRGSIHLRDVNNVLITDCIFENNTNPIGFAGALYIWQCLNSSILNTQFSNNSANSAAGIYYDARESVLDDMSLLIENCEFTDNASNRLGGAMQLNEGKKMTLVDNIFRRNTAEDGGSIFYNGINSPKSILDNLTIDNCTFSANQSTGDDGGAIHISNGSTIVKGCEFLGNSAEGTTAGGAFYAVGRNKVIEIDDCIFGTNSANWGGAVTIYSDSTRALIKNSSFISNSADSRGGAVYCGFKSLIEIDSCLFRNNQARLSGGAASCQNDSSSLVILNSEFSSNSTGSAGGALSTTTGSNTKIFNSLFQENESNSGGALSFFSDGESPRLDTTNFTLENCIFSDNFANNQGGALNIESVNGRIINSLFHDNIAEDGNGGAISHNVIDSNILNIDLDILNSSFVNNTGALASSIAAFTALEGRGEINLQNNLIFNLRDFLVEDGVPVFNSLGGNYSRDINNSLDVFNENDILEPDPLLVDLSSLDFRLTKESPCVNNGIATNTPERDIIGVLRDNSPDIGCYEYVLSTSIADIETIEFDVFPNPTSNYIILDIDKNSDFEKAYFINVSGQVVKTQRLSYNDRKIDVSNLENGLYNILINGAKKYQASFVKQ